MKAKESEFLELKKPILLPNGKTAYYVKTWHTESGFFDSGVSGYTCYNQSKKAIFSASGSISKSILK